MIHDEHVNGLDVCRFDELQVTIVGDDEGGGSCGARGANAVERLKHLALLQDELSLGIGLLDGGPCEATQELCAGL